MAYAVEESASDEKTASAVFLVNRSCAKRAVLIGLPTSRRFNEAIFHQGSKLILNGGAKNATVCAWQSGDCGDAPTYGVVCCFIYSKTNNFEFIFVPYIKPLPGKVQRLSFRAQVGPAEVRASALKNLGPK